MGTISVSLPVAATVADAGQIATDLTTIANVINGGLDNNNWASGLIFAPSKLMQEAAAKKQALLWTGSIWAPADVPYVYDRATTTVDVQNSVAETSIYTKTISGNDLGTSRSLRLRIVGDWLHNNVAGDAVTLKIKFGGTTFWNSASSLGAVLGAARHPWVMDLAVANLAATNSQMISGFLAPGEASNVAAPTNGIGNWGAAPTLGMAFGISTLGTIDTTANQTLDVTAQWSAANANNSWRMRYALLELV